MASKVKFGIYQRLLAAMLLVSMLPLGIFWYLNYQSGRQLVAENVEQKLTAISNNLVTRVDGWADMNKRMLLQNAALQGTRSMQANQQNPILTSITNKYDWTYLAFTIDPTGMNVGRSDGKKVKFYGDRAYFKQVIDGEQFGQQILIGKTSGKPAFILSTPIYKDSGHLNGVLAIAMNLSDLSEEVANVKIGRSGFAFLLDAKGEVIAHPNDQFTKARVDLSRHPAFQTLKNNQSKTIFNDDGGRKVVALARQTQQGWVLVCQQDYEEAYQPIRSENIRSLILLCVTAVIVSIFALLISRWFTNPIRRLTEVADQYSHGELNLKISGVERRDEIGLLAQSIERLGTSIQLAMKRLKKE